MSQTPDTRCRLCGHTWAAPDGGKALGCPRCESLDTGPVKESPHLRAIKSAFILFCFATFFGGGMTCFKDKGPRPDASAPPAEAEEVSRGVE